MLTPAQIAAENTDSLTDEQVFNLLILVRQYGPYKQAPARWPNLETKLEEEKSTPTVKTQGLKAVLTALGNLPPIHAESQGQDGSPGFFSVKQNWDILAQDVLDTIYPYATYVGPETIGVIRRPTETLVQKDRTNFTESETGRRY